jgi:hypothetical protein
MELSIFLAKWLGLYLLIVAADLLLRRHELEGAVRDFASSKGLLVFSGSISLLIGLAIVIAHPVYEGDWRGFITLLGYLIILRGAVRVAFPTHLQKRILSFFHRSYWAVFLILLIVGVYLTYSGFTAD